MSPVARGESLKGGLSDNTLASYTPDPVSPPPRADCVQYIKLFALCAIKRCITEQG